MTDLEALVVAAYVFADEYPVPLRGGRRPLVSDAELVALAVAQAAIGISSDRPFLGLIGRMLPGWFPHLTDQSQYNRRSAGDTRGGGAFLRARSAEALTQAVAGPHALSDSGPSARRMILARNSSAACSTSAGSSGSPSSIAACAGALPQPRSARSREASSRSESRRSRRGRCPTRAARVPSRPRRPRPLLPLRRAQVVAYFQGDREVNVRLIGCRDRRANKLPRLFSAREIDVHKSARDDADHDDIGVLGIGR
jgi:hypothetical protein